MARRRALLTDRERELIADEDAESQRYVAVSRVRTKIEDELPADLRILAEHHPDLLEELREVVCEDRDGGAEGLATSRPDPPRDTERGGELDAAEEVAPEPDVEQVDTESILEGWRPGRSQSAREERLASAEAVLNYVREQGLVTREALLEDVYPEHGVESQSEETWWRTTARGQIEKGTGGALALAVDAGAVERRHGPPHEYEWVGGGNDD